MLKRIAYKFSLDISRVREKEISWNNFLQHHKFMIGFLNTVQNFTRHQSISQPFLILQDLLAQHIRELRVIVGCTFCRHGFPDLPTRAHHSVFTEIEDHPSETRFLAREKRKVFQDFVDDTVFSATQEGLSLKGVPDDLELLFAQPHIFIARKPV